MTRVDIALGSPERYVNLGNFDVRAKNGVMDIYYNIDLGDFRSNMFDVISGSYKNLEKLHLSFHYSGQGHMKEASAKSKLIVGRISDASTLNCIGMDPLILGIESFYFNIAAKKGSSNQETMFLLPKGNPEQYSILWLFVPTDFPKQVHPRFLYVTLWGYEAGYNVCQTAALADISLTIDMETILQVNGWEIRALFLKPMLPLMSQGVILLHPKGIEKAWRALVSQDAHLPLSQMVRYEAIKKKPIFTTGYHQISAEASHPIAWVKKLAKSKV